MKNQLYSLLIDFMRMNKNDYYFNGFKLIVKINGIKWF